jgi:rfaE bifunctional protein nucleotidyltransferase chain/domain
LNLIESKLISFEESELFFKDIKSKGKSIALCHGVFDLLHPGHLRHLSKAKELADILVVSITADLFVNKGPGRPAFNEKLRAESLSNLVSVDFVVITPNPTAVEVLKRIKPNYYVKGKDYSNEKTDKTGNITRERQMVESLGGNLVNTDEIVFSSSSLINQFFSNHSPEVISWLKDFRSKFTLEEVLQWVDRISQLKVAIVGETILDRYTYCEALGKSSKDPVLCFNKENSVTYAGGVLAIACHCNGLGVETSIITTFNQQDESGHVIERLMPNQIQINAIDAFPSPTIIKERIVDSRTSSRVLEIYQMNDKPLEPIKDELFVNLINEKLNNVDLIIVADYGHGLISEEAIKAICDSDKFVAVNTQVNAGNRGLNSISRYPRANFITLNGNEARMELRRKHIQIETFVNNLRKNMGALSILISKGNEGIDIYKDLESPISSPALAPFVKDRVGAGDAVLSITSLLVFVKAPPEIVAFIGNIVGAWSTSFIGNEKNLDIGVLERQISSILK